ncbi:MAG: hypothetical protein R3202_06485, partial [Candidatus Competibacterales bacterium]|nr:hypothetical protein [Candidatus Competibacterales bacterium]
MDAADAGPAEVPEPDWWRRIRDLPDDAPAAELWAGFARGLDRLDRLAPDSVAAQNTIRRLAAVVRERLLPRLAQGCGTLLARLDATLHDLEQDLYRLAESEPSAAELLGFQARLDALAPLLASDDSGPPDPFQEVLAHLDQIDHEIRRRGDDDPAHRERLDRLRLDVLRQQAQLFVTQSESRLTVPQAPDAVSGHWQQCLQGERILLGLHRFLAARERLAEEGPLLSCLETALQTLLQRAIDGLGTLPAEQAAALLDTQGVVLVDFATELLTEAESWPRASAVQAYRRAADLLEALQRARERQGSRPPPGEIQALRRLRNEWVEQTVIHRLERRFNPRAVRRLDAFVLVLILLVLGLLIAEWLWPLDPVRRLQVELIDTVICAVFLTEFSLKLASAPDRANFFRRHWLTDLLPAIPFGLIALAIESLAVAQNTTIARALRLPALVTRKVRPVVRLVRVLLFAGRGLDRLVRRYSGLLNRDIVFFEPAPRRDPVSALRERGVRLGYRLRNLRAARAAQMPEPALIELQRRDLNYSRQRIAALGEVSPGIVDGIVRADDPTRAIRVEAMIDILVNLDHEVLEERLGSDFPQQVERLTRFAALPPLRWMPFFGDALKARRRSRDAADLAARFARRLGHRLQRLNDRILLLADLHGVVSAPQLVARIGELLVASMRLHARRLLLFGGLFVLLTLFLQLFALSWLELALQWLRNYLGLPLMIVGSIAGMLMLVGLWLRRI